jgi:hypothetical protein
MVFVFQTQQLCRQHPTCRRWSAVPVATQGQLPDPLAVGPYHQIRNLSSCNKYTVKSTKKTKRNQLSLRSGAGKCVSCFLYRTNSFVLGPAVITADFENG